MKAKLFNLFIILITLVITSCTTTKKLTKQEKDISLSIDTSSVLLHGFSGLYISDLNTNQVLFSSNAHKYFVPASNTKLFTLEACLSSLGDSIPALKYVETDSTFTFWGKW
ncbi:MAG: D-alanyl-D-alanine carboxypeptidase [Saprospiraceae bacterium]|nr:D-alanyl-D-alanine carboxypeptidase [Saprospiraceae bacterium]